MSNVSAAFILAGAWMIVFTIHSIGVCSTLAEIASKLERIARALEQHKDL